MILLRSKIDVDEFFDVNEKVHDEFNASLATKYPRFYASQLTPISVRLTFDNCLGPSEIHPGEPGTNALQSLSKMMHFNTTSTLRPKR